MSVYGRNVGMAVAMAMAKWNQKEVAEAAGVAQSTVSSLARGCLSVRESSIEKIARAFGIDAELITPTFSIKPDLPREISFLQRGEDLRVENTVVESPNLDASVADFKAQYWAADTSEWVDMGPSAELFEAAAAAQAAADDGRVTRLVHRDESVTFSFQAEPSGHLYENGEISK